MTWLMLALFLFTFPAAAQTPRDAEVDFYIKEKLDRPLTVGDQIKLRLEVAHPSGSQVVLPQLEEQWGAFEVLDQSAPDTVDNEDGMSVTGKDIIVTLFQPGQLQTPPLVVTHRKLDGSLEELAAPVIPLRVTSVLTQESQLRDLKPQAELPAPPIWPWVLGGFLLTTLLLSLMAGTGIWFYNRWKQRSAAPMVAVPFVDARPPEVIALAELDRIEALNLPAEGQLKEHYSLVDGCLRRYIEGRYQIPALEQTSSEIHRAFKKSTIPTRHANSFMTVFTESNLVKFARYMPEPASINGLIGKARAIVRETTSVPEEAEPAVVNPEVRT